MPRLRSIAVITSLPLAALALTAGCDPASELLAEDASARTLAPPTLYSAPLHESPVRADPGDLLLIPGVDFASDAKVIYKALGDTTLPLGQAPAVPGTSTAALGQITPIRIDDNALTVRLPAVMTAGRSYGLWVVGADGESDGIRINDARPMWLSPAAPLSLDTQTHAYLHTTVDRPGLTRELKVIGRNLQPAPGQQTRVRLSGNGNSLILTAANDGDPSTAIERYVASVFVPTGLTPGEYGVAVSRDGLSWVPSPVSLLIAPDPVARPRYSIALFGSGDATYKCAPDDGEDDTYCITRALHYAELHAGDVVVPPGRWLIDANIWNNGTAVSGTDSYAFSDPPAGPGPGPAVSYPVGFPMDSQFGLRVPAGVNLMHEETGAVRPILETGEHFAAPFLDFTAPPSPTTPDPGRRIWLFALEGNNTIKGLHFTTSYKPVYKGVGATPGVRSLFIGGHFVTITDNFFDDIYTAASAWWHTLPDPGLGNSVIGSLALVVTDNTFAAYTDPLDLPTVQSGLIRGNTFWPGATGAPIAISVRGSRHLEISDNAIDGEHTAYSGSQMSWRAGMVFSSEASNEHLLVSGNEVTCTGLRRGEDGESIATDSHLDYYGFKSGQTVTASSATTVSVQPPPGATLLSTAAGQFDGRWVRIDHGPGLGQTRKIIAASEDSAGVVQLTISPPFDVPPVAGESRILVGQQSWQAYMIDNSVDNTCSLARPDYADLRWNGGLMGFYGSAADSVIESNEQLHTAGIILDSMYDFNEAIGARRQTSQYFVEVRGNSITGSYGDNDNLPNVLNTVGSGIYLLGQLRNITSMNTIVPTDDHTGFGVAISHNTLVRAALAQPTGSNHVWAIGVAAGGAPEGEATMPAYDDTLVFRNTVRDIPAPWYPVEPWKMWPAGQSLSISNGQSIPGPVGFGKDYPHNTTVCDNDLEFGAAGIGDFHGSLTSTLIVCP